MLGYVMLFLPGHIIVSHHAAIFVIRDQRQQCVLCFSTYAHMCLLADSGIHPDSFTIHIASDSLPLGQNWQAHWFPLSPELPTFSCSCLH